MMTFQKNKAPGARNELIVLSEGWLSYNPAPCSELGSFFSSDRGEETAFYYKDTWMILNGDFRKQFEAATSDSDPVSACLRVYMENRDEHRSTWSTDNLDGSRDKSILAWLEERLKPQS